MQNGRSLERPEKWKHHLLKSAGMFYCAERQEPRAPRKMETPLAEDRWHVLLRRTTRPQRATPRKMETLFSEAQLHVRLCKMTEAVGETPTFDVRITCSIFGRRAFFCGKPYAKTSVSIGEEGAMLFSTFQNDRSRRRNAHFRLSNRIFDFWGEGVLVRSPTRKHHFRLFTPLGPL